MTNNMTKLLSIAGLAFTLCITSGHAIAEQIKLKHPLEIDADEQAARLKENVGIFRHNVQIKHGNMTITADYLEAHKRAELGDNQQLLIASGDPVKFIAEQEDGSIIVASAKKVTYDVAKSLFTMSGGAKFQQNGDMMSADTIIYDRAAETVTSKKAENSTNQVKTIINTQNEQGEQ